MRTVGKRGMLGIRRGGLRGVLLILVIVGIEGMALVRRRVDGETRLLCRRLGAVGRRSPRHDGRVCRPRGGKVLFKVAASTESQLR